MYMTMVRKQCLSGALLLCLLLISRPVTGLEKTVELGKEGLWGDIQSMEGVQPVAGRWGFKDLVLASGTYDPDSSTEMLFHFDAPAPADATGAYLVRGSPPSIQAAVSAVGGASAAFDGSRQGVTIQPPPDGMFAAGAVWGDFTIEFWMYPSALSEGETIMAWTGSTREVAGAATGTAPAGRLLGQGFRCYIRDRRLVWDFKELFTLPGGSPRIPVTLAGTRQLLPRTWHHHLLRFNAREGLLEYSLDGTPEAITHVTDTGRETGSIAVPILGLAFAGPLVLGQGFSGFLDEMRVSRRFVDDAVLTRFLGKTGTVTSRIIDLGFSSTRIARIEAVTATPSDTAVEFFYQVADAWKGKKLLGGDTDWVPFTPGTDFKDTLSARYIQIRVELFPDGTRTQSPRLSSVKVVYEPNPPPAPPAGLVATPGNGKVTLTWRKVNDLDVKGYMVFYGTAPHNFLGTGAAQGESPLDAGAATTIEIDGLSNGSLYYFAVTAYDTSTPQQQSGFSPEVSARPSRIYK
jgi:hypothetical protein